VKGQASFQRRPRPRDIADPQTHAAVRELREAVAEIQDASGQDGRLIASLDPNNKLVTSITFTNGAITKIQHGLGRPLKGWRVEDEVLPQSVVAAGKIFRVTSDGTDTADDAKEIWLKAVGYGSSSPTGTLWVY